MTKPPSRDILKIIFQNFWKSLQPRQICGTYIGDDYFGNKYYEIPANPAIGKRKASRWFEPKEKEDFEQELTAEWEAWLRGRRQEPPTREEMVQNLQIMEMKKRNAAQLDAIHGKPKDATELEKEKIGMGSFPKYDEYENVPGVDPPKKY